MTIEEAIVEFDSKARECELYMQKFLSQNDYDNAIDWQRDAQKYRQLINWLEELKRYRQRDAMIEKAVGELREYITTNISK